MSRAGPAPSLCPPTLRSSAISRPAGGAWAGLALVSLLMLVGCGRKPVNLDLPPEDTAPRPTGVSSVAPPPVNAA